MTPSRTTLDPARQNRPAASDFVGALSAARLIRVVIVASTLLLVAIWSGIALDLRHERSIYTAQAERDARNLAIAFEHHVETTVVAIDALVLSLRHELLESMALPPQTELIEWTRSGPLRTSIVQIGIIDAQGNLVYTSANTPRKTVYVGDRDHFRAHLTPGPDRLYISKPIRARTNDLELIPFSRRITGPDGDFRGVVSVLVRTEHFSHFYETIDIGEQGAITLLRDGIVVARASHVPTGSSPLGVDLRAVLPGPEVKSELRMMQSPIDGLTGLTAYRRLPEHPLAVMVAMTEHDYLHEYRASMRTQLTVGSIVSFGTLVLAWLLIRLARDLDRSRQAASASERRYRELFENAPVAYQSLDEMGRLVAVNAAWERLFGVAAAEAIGRPVEEFIGFVAAAQLCCRNPALAAPVGVDESPFSIRRRDGTARVVSLSSCTPVDASARGHSHCVLRDVTEELAQAVALKANENRLRDIVENTSVATWEFDLASKRFTYVAPQVETLFGYPAADWLAEGFWRQHLHPDDRDASVALSARQVAAGIDHNLEFRLVRRNGTVAWVRGIVRVLRDEYGVPERLTGVMLDITSEKTAAAEIERQRALLRGVIDSVPDLIFFKDVNSVYLGCNSAFAEFAGRPEDEQIGKTDRDFFDADTAASFRAKDQEMLAAGEPRRNEEWVRHHDGRKVLLETLKAPFRDASGKPLGLIGISRDITARRQAEEGQILARAVFESTNEGIMVTDAEPRILAVNPAFTAITGWTADEVVGQKPSLLGSGRHPKAFYAALWSVLSRDGHWEGEIWNRRKDGEVYAQWMTISALRDADGKVGRYVALFSDITVRKTQEQQIWRQANFDALTGLANRNLFHDRLERALAHGRRTQQQVGLMFIDLDRFKWINDTLGHEAGDQLLVEAAARLRECVRDEDTVARLGGDEFTIILQGLSERDHLQAVSEKVLEALARPFVLDGAPQYISGSVGVTMFPNDADNTRDLVRNADIAMYQAKAAGRGRYQFYSPDMQADALARMEIERDLRRALAHDEFVLYFQPIVDADSRELISLEALLRWQHPTRGVLLPGDFLAVAQDCGLAVPIAEWVVDAACAQWRAWADAGLPPPHLAINVADAHFREAALCRSITAALHRHAVPGAMLTLELTEALLAAQHEHLSERLGELQALGVHFSLDDFGTGLSSLNSLSSTRFETVKIDRGFFAHAPLRLDDQRMIEAIVLMAHSLGLEVVAEGVECEDQLEFLRDLGCDQVQGFLIGAAVDAARCHALLDRPQSADALVEESRFLAALRGTQLDSRAWVRRLLAARAPDLATTFTERPLRIASLDVEASIVAHLQWRVRIEATIRDDCADALTVDEAGNEHCCTLGHWIDAQAGDPITQGPSFATLIARHREFHQLAASILADLTLGRRAEAGRRVRGLVFREASHAIVTALIDLFVEESTLTSRKG